MTTTTVNSNYISGSVSGSSSSAMDLFLRVLAFVLTLVAAVVLGVDKQTAVVSMSLLPTLPPLNVTVAAKYKYLSAFVYFVVANAIACGYSAISLLLTLITSKSKNKRKGVAFMIIVLDLIMVGLLFSGGGAALAVGVVGYQGNSHVRWKKVCNVFGKFCNQAAASIVVSLIGAIVYLFLVLIAAFKLHNKLY